MVDAAPESQGLARTFDLSSAPVLALRLGRSMRWFSLMAFAVLEGLIIFFGVMNAIDGIPVTPGNIAFTALIVGACALFLLPYFGLAPGAATAVLNSSGLTLVYRSGRRRAFSWADIKLKLELSAITEKGGVEFDLTTPMPWHNDLTPDAFEAILAQAHVLGLTVESDVVNAGTASIQTYTIRNKRN